ncbi:hypothetical protein EG832_16175, partial [bacterium]|nr:hypothetical protein [bacterium]
MKKTVLHAVVIMALIGQLIPLQKVFANPTSITSPVARQLDILRDDSSIVIGESSETGKVTFIGSSDGNPISTSIMSFIPFVGGNDSNSAALDLYAPMFGIDDYTSELSMESSVQADKDRTVSRYQQLYQGIPVMAGEITVNTSSSGGLYSMMGEASPDLSMETTPQIDAAEAVNQAAQLMTSRYGVAAGDVSLSTPVLWIYDPRLLESSSMPAELVWRIEARSASDQSLDVLILVNAIRGGISLHFNQIDSDVSNGVWQTKPLAQEGPTTQVPVTETTQAPIETPTEIVTEVVTETPVPTETPTPTELPTETPTETALVELPGISLNAINGTSIRTYTMNNLTETSLALPGNLVCDDTQLN